MRWGWAVIMCALVGCGVPRSSVVINEVTSSGDDQIELLNTGTEPVDLAGWRVTDQDPTMPGHRFTFLADSQLPPGAYWVLAKGVDHDFGLGTDNAVRLEDAEGLLIDEADWAAGQARISFCRLPNGTGFFEACDELTLGRTNEVPPL